MLSLSLALDKLLFGIITVPDFFHAKLVQAVEIEIGSLVTDLDESVEL